ncbi:hypothetical protein FHR72_000458 [Mycolicibacterium iranicum]|uniref:PE-PPE domain-containing protein n=1 Tax=Mycolicibacterium iranicum TaxID=912594 RepID=A0A839Q8S2_MYCIR|nr:PE-PPE domain-containing protein [Mycolicibacterium iranicum]MBB2989001.1 hypothetical protein [Mycolicibacterium iranicum]
MNRQRRRALAGALAVPAAVGLCFSPTASAATVLAVEGTAQLKGNAQTAFGNEFCAHNTCRSINNARTPFDVKPGSRQLQAAVQSTAGDIILMGYSLGAATIYDRLRAWEKSPGTSPDPGRVVLVVTYGNPENKFGGDDRKNSYAGLPAVQPYAHLDVTMQYDSVADVPTRWGWYSRMNLAFAQHMAYFQDIDINDPDNLVYHDADGTTYMLIKADTLPMLKWMDPWLSDARMAELDAKYRPLIEKDYDRPDYAPQGEGADWGNGTPPPAAQTSESNARQRDSHSAQDPDDVDDASPDDVGDGAGQGEPGDVVVDTDDEPRAEEALADEANDEAPADEAPADEVTDANGEDEARDTPNEGSTPAQQSALRPERGSVTTA